MFKVVVPTLNAAKDWPCFSTALLKCVPPDHVLIVDSESNDGTLGLAKSAGFQVHTVRRAEFNHGGTRQLAAELLPRADHLVYMTQDSILHGSDSIAQLVAAFRDPQVGAAYGRQLPRRGAGAIEAHGRIFNYPARSEVRSLQSRGELGIKTAFLSNSLAAYRRSALIEIGGFRSDVLFGEDTIAAACLLLAGYKIAYVAEACTCHSHPYTPLQEFRRYFDVGAMHSMEPWLLNEFGSAGSEGKRFVISELRYLREEDVWKIPSAVFRTALKLLGYRIGRRQSWMPTGIKRRLSMHPRFWK